MYVFRDWGSVWGYISVRKAESVDGLVEVLLCFSVVSVYHKESVDV